ncbi:MAG: hypothetical protein KDK36_22290, partial [Leptospiraceae bacterium]|nr:hypothetical protein [Leptospiraceae bacterium]
YPLFFSFLGLYLTKYPYGYIFLVIVSIILLLKFPEEILNILKNYLSELNFFSNCLDRENIGKRSLFYLSIIFLLIYIFLPIQFWKGKSASYIKFIIGLFLAIDLVFFVLRRKEYIKEIRPEIFYLFVYLFLPVIIWTFIHPDRFSSSGGTLKHIQSEGLKVGQVVEKNISYYLFYIRVLFYEIWRFFPIGIFLFFTMAFAFIKGAYTYLKTRKIRFYFLNSIFIVFSLLILTFGTPNHQARHTYHLVPLLIFQFPLLVSKKRNLLTIGISIIPFILSGYFLFFLYSKEFSKSYLCFSGVEKIYEMPLEFEKVLEDKLQSPSFLYNGIEENHLNRADIELIFAKVNSEKNLIFETNKRKFLKQKEKFPVVVSVSRECISELNLKEPLIKFEEKRIKDSCVGFWKN